MFDTRSETTQILKTGIMIGLAGGIAEIAVVCSYAALTGTDAAGVAHGIAASFGIHASAQSSVDRGIAIHMLLAGGLGCALSAALQALPSWARSFGAVPFMLGSLAAVWAFNFFVVLPVINPSFVHLLPYGVTLASKLAFGAAAAFMLGYRHRLRTPSREVTVLSPAR